MDKIIDTGCFEIGQVFCIVQVTLRVQVTVADLDGMIKEDLGHRADYKA
jgi:hypothetical protein